MQKLQKITALREQQPSVFPGTALAPSVNTLASSMSSLIRAFRHNQDSHFQNVLVNLELLAFCVNWFSQVRDFLAVDMAIF